MIGNNKLYLRLKRKSRIRQKVKGTKERPRMTVFKSLNYMYTQVIDDDAGVTLAAASTVSKDVREKLKNGKNMHAAELLGDLISSDILKKGIKSVVFDRNGYQYHGKVKAFADKVRSKGVNF